jgi:IstB-like ATP binding protein
VTSNKPFGRWGETFGDAVVAAAMMDRLVHRAEVVRLKGDSYRSKTATSGGCPLTTQRDHRPGEGVNFQPSPRGLAAAVDELHVAVA